MFHPLPARLALSALVVAAWLAAPARLQAAPFSFLYPRATPERQVDTYHGTSVADPYRWLEDIDSERTRAWVQAEGDLARFALDALPRRQSIRQRARALVNFERWSVPERHGSAWFYTHNSGLDAQSIVYVTDDPAEPGRALLDPNTLNVEGTFSEREVAISPDGRYYAYSLSAAGSDWQTWHVREVATGLDLPDELHWSKAGGASWLKDGSGFYYTLFDAPPPGDELKVANSYQKLALHRLGTPQADDAVVYTRTDQPDWFVSGQVSEDGRWLLLQSFLGDDIRGTLVARDLAHPDAPERVIAAEPVALMDVIGSAGELLYVRTDLDAPRYRVVAIDLANPLPAHWRTLVPQGNDVLRTVTLVGGQLLVRRLHEMHSEVERYDLAGHSLGSVALPGAGTTAGFTGQAGDTATYFAYSSYGTPLSIYRLELASGSVTAWHEALVEGFNGDGYETTLEFASSRDGTRVPVLVTARKGLRRNGRQPTLLYGYGGFNIPVTPAYSPAVATWIAGGGVYALAVLRGGGEFGREWHEAGTRTHKQNVFDDFIAAAEQLKRSRWTSSRHLALWGGSNGGLLVAAVELQKPDLAAAAIPEVGVLDMLRFREFTVGRGWESDYGSVDNPDEFRALLAYSPYHNVRRWQRHPATLVTTADHDDRVFPAHSFKFTAALQNAGRDGPPVLLRLESRAGHGRGLPTDQRIEKIVDLQSFALWAFDQAR
jgi:prolyl oligopeptidase